MVSHLGRCGPMNVHRDVTQNYEGEVHSANTSVKQATSIASPLSWRAIEAIRPVTSIDFFDVIISGAALNKI